MSIPKYLETFRRAAREAETREKSEVSEKRGEEEGLNSLNTLISPSPTADLLPFGRINRFGRTYAALESRCPAHVDHDRWQDAVEDGKAFLAKWGAQAESLGWSSRDVFGLHTPPDNPHPSYRRLSRYDATGLVWLLQGRAVVALTADTAAIESVDARGRPTGSITVFRKSNRPALGPMGDSLEDLK